ncbi:hypothetical protein LEMLEM_LOCUS13974 [Lemmus lemmus]
MHTAEVTSGAVRVRPGRLPGAGDKRVRWEREPRAGRAWRGGESQLPEVEVQVCVSGVGGEDPGARSLKGWRKCSALDPHSRRKLAGWARACGAAGRWAPGAVRPPRPSARAPGARAPPAPPGSPCLARTFSFSPRRCRRQVPAPRPAALACSAAPSLGARSAPHRLARALGLGGGGSSSGTVAAAPSSSFPGAAAERRALLPGSGQSGRQLLPAAPGTAGGSAPAVVRSVSAARPGPGSRHREQLAAGLRLPALPGRSRPPAAAFTSPMRGELWPESTGGGDYALLSPGARAAVGTPAFGEVASASSLVPGGGLGTRLQGLLSGLGPPLRCPLGDGAQLSADLGESGVGAVTGCPDDRWS